MRRVSAWGTTILVLCATVGCGPRNTPVDRANTLLAQQSYQWSADPSIDLLTGAAVPVRAYLESRLDSQTMGSIAYAYPGFDDAVAKVTKDDRNNILLNNLRSDATTPIENPAIGDNVYRMVTLTRTSASVAATICNYRYRMALKMDNGTFRNVTTTFVNDDGIDALRVFMEAPAEPSALPPQKGPAPAPTDNVFGGWRITGLLDSFAADFPAFAALWPTYDADLARCVAEAPDPPERREFLARSGHPRTDFPTSPPNPGWPAATGN